MTNVSESPAARSPGITSRIWRHADSILAGAVIGAFALKILLAFRINVHWDEFYFLSFVHDYARGDLTARHQAFHVHLFSWLVSIEGEIRQIMAARLVMAALAIASAMLIYGIARCFAARGGALFAMLGYLALSVVVEHGASFRTDPIATFLMLLSLFALIRWPGSVAAATVSGAALGLAALVTIKIALFFPVIALAAWCLVPRLRDLARVALAAGAAFALSCGALYLFHASTLAAADPVGTVSFLRKAATKVLIQDGLFARVPELLYVIAFNPLFWIMAGEGAVASCRIAVRRRERKAWLPLILALPALIPLLYRNAFPYFFPLVLAPAAILLAIFYEKHRQAAIGTGKGSVPTVLAAFIAVQCGMLAFHVVRNLPDEVAPQRAVLAAVHQVFPEPVPYIGGFGVAATFPRLGFFMSTWGMESYYAAGRPVFPELVAKKQPPFLLADSPSLYGAVVPDTLLAERRRLLPADVQVLKDHYVAHWGMLFVAGKQFQAAAGAREFEIAIAGDYRVESSAPVRIDGQVLQPGAVIQLAAGRHHVEPDADAVLRWAKALPPPPTEPVGLLPFFGVHKD